MFKLTLRRGVLGALGFVLVTGGIAYATTSSGGLAACAKPANGQLRLDTGDGCLPSEQQVTLGDAPVTRADERYYVAPNLADPSTFLPLGTAANRTAVVTMHVPDGDYAIAAQVTFNGSGGSGDVPCVLVDQSGTTHGYAEESYDPPAVNNTMTIDGALSLAVDTDISLVCWNIPFGGGRAGVRAADITTKTVDVATITQETH